MIYRVASFFVICWFIATAVADDDQYFDSDGVKIHYVVEGEGEPVILIHGFTSSIQQEWRRTGVLPTLSESFQVIALDTRGHGKSQKLHDPEMYGSEMANDVLRLMDHLNLPKAHVVGYSLGGLTTEYLLVNHPDRLVTATLGGMGWIKPDDQRLALTGALALWLENGKQIGQFVQKLQPTDAKASDKKLAAPFQVLVNNDSASLAACARAIPGLTVTEDQLKANKVPTFAIVGGNDSLKVSVEDLKEVMPNLQVELIDGTDHESTLRAKRFVEAIQEFLKAHPAAPMTDQN